MSKTKSIGINFSGYPYSASHFILDNGGLLLLDALSDTGHDAVFFDFNVPSAIDALKISTDTQHSLENAVNRILSLGDKIDPALLQDLNAIEESADSEREDKVRIISTRLIEYIQRNDVGWVWMKLWTGDGFRYSQLIAQEIKKAVPGIKIVGGGHHVRLFRKHVFDLTDSFDVLSYGEGEIILPLLGDWVAGSKDLDKIPGIMYKQKKHGNTEIIDTKGSFLAPVDLMNRFVLPKHFHDHYFPIYVGLEEKILMGLSEISRGCPNDHPYCQHTLNSGASWRLVNPEVVVENIRRLNDNNIFVIRFADSNPPRSQQLLVYELMKKSGLTKNLITAFCEIPQFTEELGSAFRSVGGFSYFFGVESGCERILKGLGKNYSPGEANYKIQMAKQFGIKVVASFMIPTINDDEISIAETEAFILSSRPDFCPLLPTIPMAKMLDDPGRYGYTLGPNFLDVFQYYSPKLHIPPQLGSSLPVNMGCWSWDKLKAICGGVAYRLERGGIPTVISDETLLLAELAGKGDDPKTFNREFIDSLRKGDSEYVSECISRINQRVSQPQH